MAEMRDRTGKPVAAQLEYRLAGPRRGGRDVAGTRHVQAIDARLLGGVERL